MKCIRLVVDQLLSLRIILVQELPGIWMFVNRI
jgi:hypothetical protein